MKSLEHETKRTMSPFVFPTTVITFTGSDTDAEHKPFVKVLSDGERAIIEIIFYVALNGLFGLLGIIANIINIVIFYKQGFFSTGNIAFFSLAVSDLLCLMFLVSASVCMNPLLPILGVKWIGVEVMYVSSGWPHMCFCRITSYITVYITAERCLSIVFPLRVKKIVTRTKTTVILALIFSVNLLTVVPEWATSNLGLRFAPEQNRTLLAVIFTSSRKSVEGYSFFIHSIFNMASFFGVVFFTVVLFIKLRQNSHLRSELTSGSDQKGSMSARDKKAVKMIVLIASILIVCYIPGAMASMTVFVVGPEFMIQGKYINICSSIWGIAFSFQSINSSINIFLYYRMSSKYRQTFNEHFNIISTDRK